MANPCSFCPWKTSANTTSHPRGKARIVRPPLAHIAARFSTLELGRYLFVPVDIASVVYFRIAFGAIMLWQMWRYIDSDWIQSYFLDPDFLFTYLGFDWVQPWPGIGLYIHFYVLAILALFILTGFLYRLSTTLFFLGFTYIFLLEQARYLNHYYLICLVSLLLIFVPPGWPRQIFNWPRSEDIPPDMVRLPLGSAQKIKNRPVGHLSGHPDSPPPAPLALFGKCQLDRRRSSLFLAYEVAR